jgi:GcrA cell cycle regulator
MASIWDDPKNVEKLKLLWTEKGFSALQIAEELGGIGRSAVIGKIHRLKLTGKGIRSHGQHQTKKKRAKRKFTLQNLPLALRPAPTSPDALSGESIPALRLPLEKLERGMCRYPYGEKSPYAFCGAAALEDKPYCRAHQALCYGASFDRMAARAIIAA